MPEREARRALHVGGQAVIEGVMMRSPTRLATAVRTPDGEVVVSAEFFVSLAKRHRLLGLPIVRGAVSLFETFMIAVKALNFSAEHAAGEGGEAGGGLSTLHMVLTVAGAFLLGLALFFYIPLKLTELAGFESGLAFNLVDGLIRLVFIVLYIILVSLWKEMRRIFEYHGAEHKTIFAFEAGEEVTPETVKGYPRMHPRCSTSFLLIVVIVSILVFMFFGRPEHVGERLLRLAAVPVIAGLSYEVLRLSALPGVRRWLGFVFWPGIFLQRFTTREPSADQIEVAIAALEASLAETALDS